MNFLENLASYYDLEAEKFHGTRKRHRPEFDVLADEIKKRFPKKKKLKVLELGCGSGRLLGYLQKALPTKELEYTGVDISYKLIEIARKEFSDGDRDVGNMTEFLHEAEQESYDIIIANASFHHLPSVRTRIGTANQIYRALAYDGFCFMTNWSDSERFQQRFRKSIVTAWAKSILSLGIYRPHDLFLPWKSDTHKKVYYRYYHIFSLEELEKIAKIAGFGDISEFYITGEGEHTADKKLSRNSCSIWGKMVFLDE